MDVQSILVAKISGLPSGEHSEGLKAVRAHIESAIRHFRRGQQEGAETYFTDAIYRCNQAFEGSIKEAYRVLASKNPEKVSLAEIETFLASGTVLRKKVLDQFTNYRREWRNPSTHDYKLDFDEDEALVAIVSVAVFSIVLCDQIESKLAFLSAQAAASATPPTQLPAGDPLDQVAEVVKRFAESYKYPASARSTPLAAVQHVEGTLGGFLAAELSKLALTVKSNVMLGRNFEADLLVQGVNERIVIELKLTRRPQAVVLEQALRHVERLIGVGHASGGIALLLLGDEREYGISVPNNVLSSKVRVVSPLSWPSNRDG